jgi:hypothetical protein
LAALVFAIITLHGQTTWFDGLQLLVIYLLIALVIDCARDLRPAGAGRKVTVLAGWTSAHVLTSGIDIGRHRADLHRGCSNSR